MEQVIKRKSLFCEYFFLLFAILWSGGSFTYGQFEYWPYFMLPLAAMVLFTRHQRLEACNWVVIAIVSIVIIIQTVAFGGIATSIVTPIVTIVSVTMMAVIIRPTFSHVFISIIAFFALFSLLFWIIDITPVGHGYLINFAKQLPQYGGNVLAENDSFSWARYQNYTLYLYSVSDFPIDSSYYSISRNPGPFYEPGRFTIVLTIALSIILFNGLFNKYKSAFFIILVADLTTFSTTGYFALIVLFASYILGRKKKVSFSNVILFIGVLIVAYYVLEASFMRQKVLADLSDVDNTNARFGAMLYHWSQIVRSPIIGYGSFLSKSFSDLRMSPCGLTDMMRRWGIPTFCFFIWLLYQGSKTYLSNNTLSRLAFVLILLILAYTQTIMNNPLYYLFYFIGSKFYVYEGDV